MTQHITYITTNKYCIKQLIHEAILAPDLEHVTQAVRRLRSQRLGPNPTRDRNPLTKLNKITEHLEQDLPGDSDRFTIVTKKVYNTNYIPDPVEEYQTSSDSE